MRQSADAGVVYRTLDTSDDTPQDAQADVKDNRVQPLATPASKKDIRAASESKASNSRHSPQDPSVLISGLDQSALSQVMEPLDGPRDSLAALKTPLRRTVSQKLRDDVFGGDEDDLSDLESIPDPPERPSKKISGNVSVAPLPRPASKDSISAASSDDFPSSPTRLRSARKAQRKTVVISEDEIEDVIPPSRIIDSSISRQRSVLQMRPLNPKAVTTDRNDSSPTTRTVTGPGLKVSKEPNRMTSGRPAAGRTTRSKTERDAEKASKPEFKIHLLLQP